MYSIAETILICILHQIFVAKKKLTRGVLRKVVLGNLTFNTKLTYHLKSQTNRSILNMLNYFTKPPKSFPIS